MRVRTLHIVVLEPSLVIYEGLMVLLNQMHLPVTCRKASTLQELYQLALKTPPGVVIANPICVANQSKQVNALRRDFSETRWIGLLYAFYDPATLSLFDDTISLLDSRETLFGKIGRTVESSTEKDQQELLSDREVEVLLQLVKGKTNKEIAEALSISTHTVITHRKNISHKTGIKSVPGLTIYAVVNHFLTIDSAS